MPRYIDAGKVEKWSWQEPRYSDSINDRTDLRDFLRSLPTVSPDEVRGVGKWERDEYEDNKFWANYCSLCCSYLPYGLEWKPNYCPSCGARMGGVQDALS